MLIGTVALGLLLPGIADAVLKTDPAASSVSATFKQLNVPVEAKFRKFTAQIDYDSGKAAAAKATIEIDVPSFDLGDPERMPRNLGQRSRIDQILVAKDGLQLPGVHLGHQHVFERAEQRTQVAR